MTVETFMTEMLGFMKSRARRLWPNQYIDVHGFVMGYADTNQQPVLFRAIPNDFPAVVEAREGARAPLNELALELINYLRVAPLVDFSAVDYFAQPLGELRWWKVPEDPRKVIA